MVRDTVSLHFQDVLQNGVKNVYHIAFSGLEFPLVHGHAGILNCTKQNPIVTNVKGGWFFGIVCCNPCPGAASSSVERLGDRLDPKPFGPLAYRKKGVVPV